MELLFDFQTLLTTVITMFIILIIGYLARKIGYVNDVSSKFLSNFIICVAQPFMLFGAIITIEYSIDNIKTGAFIIIFGIIIHIILAVIAFAATLKFKESNERRLTEYSMIFANCGFLGFPILKSMFGDMGLFWGSFYVIVFNLMSWTYGMYVLSKTCSAIKMSFVKIFVNYGTTPCLIGLAVFFTRVKLPSPVMNAIDYMGSLCTPLTLIIVGGLIATIPIRQLFTNFKIFYLALFKLFINPIVIALLCKLIGLETDMILFGTVMAALPTAANTVMFSERFEIKSDYAAHGVGMTTLLSSFSIPAVMYIVSYIITL